MDGLFSLIWMAFIVVTVVNAITGKNKKKQKKQASLPPREQTVTYQELLNQWGREQEVAAKTEKTAFPPQPVTQSAPMAPRVHTHLAPDCDLDDPSGSMDFISTEGVDPCHDDELANRATPRQSFPVVQEQPGLSLEWTSDALVKSVIMQEVLTRPSQRRR